MARELIKKLLQLKGHTLVGATNGKEGLAAVKARVPDLVLLDLAMPEMDGVAFLENLRANPAHRSVPVIVLTAVGDHRLVRRVAQLGVRSYLLKSKFSWDELEARIQKELQAPKAAPGLARGQALPKAGTPAASVAQETAAPVASAAPKPLTREQTIEHVEKHAASKTLAGVVAEVIGLTSSPRGSVAELVSLIKRDAVLATRVLQVANTAAFTTNKPRVMTVDEAVRNIGLGSVRNIATTVGIFDAFPPDAADGFNLMRCWQHSFAVAAILERITAKLDGLPPGAAHLVGLCHDLAEIVLRQCFAEQYENVSVRAAASGEALADAQIAAFGVPTHELAALIVAKIALPPAIANPIREYAELGRRRGGNATQLAQALRLADLYAHGLLLASSPHALVAPVSQAECRSALGQTAPDVIDGVALRCEVLSTANLFARLSAKDEAKLAQPLYPTRTVNLWYARHPSFSSFDPLEAALAQLCTIRVVDRLPRGEELITCDAVVVATPRPNLQGFTHEDVTAIRGPGGRPNVPLLYLAGLIDEVAPQIQPCLEVRTYPVPLSSLANFLDAVQKAESSNAAPSSPLIAAA